jgi:hypothetical protein
MIGFNGTGLSLQPTESNWVEQESLGINGWGQAYYPSVREFNMVFNLSSQQDVYELIDYFNRVSMTGTLVATLPEWGSPVFRYKDYSGTILRQPTVGPSFAEEYSTEVRATVIVRT